jgi:hypothetical protein
LTAARADAAAAKEKTQRTVGELAKDHPLLKEDGLPEDSRINKSALARADENQLSALLQTHIARRTSDVAEAQARILDKPAVIYKMEKLMPQFYARQGIAAGSIYDLIIQDKMRDDSLAKIGAGLLLALIAIALSVLSAGTAIPLVAAASGLAGLSIGAHAALEEYREYAEQQDLADVGLAEEPSTFWLTVAIIAAGFDAASAVKALEVLGPAARTFHAGGDLDEFVKSVKALEDTGKIDATIARTAANAAKARKGLTEARDELGRALVAKAYAAPGPFADEHVFRVLVRMAAMKTKEGVESIDVFLDELKSARQLAKIGEMTPEELTKAKEAWEQGLRLVRSEKEPIDILGRSGRVIGRYSNGSHLEIIPSNPAKDLYGGNTIRLDADATTTVTGTLRDTRTVLERGVQLPGATVTGPNEGGINLLRSSRWEEIQRTHKHILDAGDESAYWRAVADEFWETVNKPWLDDAMARGDNFRFISDPKNEKAIFTTDAKNEFILDNGNRIKSIFGREVDYLTSNGYVFQPDGTAVKVK